MIRNLFLLMALAFVMASCGGAANDEGQNDETSSVEATETPTIALGEFESKAADFVDQEIMVAGIVDHVCKHGGKKLFLVDDEGDVHIDSDTRFDEALKGSKVNVKGIVREFRVDEAYCLKMEEDNVKSHSEGQTEDELFDKKKAEIQFYRDSMATAGVDHLSFYSIEYLNLDVLEEPADQPQEEEI